MMEMMEKENIMVSVLCTAYNHEKYIKDCLEGFVNQKTSFRFEVLINDDASTDNTAKVIKEYEHKFPDIIKPIYQTENQYSKGVSIINKFLLPNAKGTYIALCEGDDFWNDNYKLEKQVNALRDNPECNICFHKVLAVSPNGESLGKFYPFFPLNTGVIKQYDLLEMVCKYYVFQTSSYMIKRDVYCDYKFNLPTFAKVCPIGDVPTLLYFGTLGSAYYIDNVMSSYRMASDGSWSEKQNNNTDFRINHFHQMEKMTEEFKKYTNNKYLDLYSDLYHRWYTVFWQHKDFKEVIRKPYKQFFSKENIKDRIFIKISVYLPFLANIYSKIKK